MKLYVFAPVLCCAVLGAELGHAQQKPSSLIWNYSADNRSLYLADSSGHIHSIGHGLSIGQQFIVTIKSINTLRYTATFDFKPNSYNSTPPTQFKGYSVSGSTGASGDSDSLRASQAALNALSSIATEAQKSATQVATDREAEELARVTAKKVDFALSQIQFKPAKDDAAGLALRNAIDNTTDAYKSLADKQSNSLKPNALALKADLQQLASLAFAAAAAAVTAGNAGAESVKSQILDPISQKNVMSAIETIKSVTSADYIGDINSPSTFTASGDSSTVTITLTDTQASPGAAKIPATSVEIPTNGGLKADFSGGLILTALTSASYESVATGTGTFNAAVKTWDKQRVVPAVFEHTYIRRMFGDFNLALTLGITTETTPEYAAGISFIAGRSQRIVLTVGETFGNVTRLDGKGPFTSSNIPTVSVFMSRPFIGLSYNF